MSVSAAFPSIVLREARSIPASVNAWSVGAKSVNGPEPCNVSNNSAWTTAETRVSCIPVHCAVRGISFGVSVGLRTLSMTWIIPLLVETSVAVTLASLTITPLTPTVKESGFPLAAVADRHSVTFAAGTSPAITW